MATCPPRLNVNLSEMTGAFPGQQSLYYFYGGHGFIYSPFTIPNNFVGGPLFSQRILIVDDDIAVGTVVKIALDDKYDVATTTSALKAYKYLSECQVDLILLDIKMPGINGIAALREIKKSYPDTIVIMLTAYASKENMQQAELLGAYGFISKPFEVDELRTYVGRVLSGNRLRKSDKLN